MPAAKKEVTEIKLNFENVSTFELMDTNCKYLATITDSKLVQTKGKKDAWHLEYSVKSPDKVNAVNEDGSPTGRFTPSKNRKIFRLIVLEEKVLPFAYETVKACFPDMELGKNFNLKPSEYIGCDVCLTIQIEKSEGYAPKNTIKRVKPAADFSK
jgi:hypothetical protein